MGPTGIAGALLRLNRQAGNRVVGALIEGRASLPALRVQRQALGLGALGIETDLDNELEGVPKSHRRDQKHQAPRPRSLSEDLDPRSMSRQEVNAELDAISTYLATGPPAAEIKKLGLARLLLDDAVAVDDRVRDETVRRNDITVALASAPGSGERQMRETLAVIEGISADPDHRGVWLLHSGVEWSLPWPRPSSREGRGEWQLGGIAHELTKVMTHRFHCVWSAAAQPASMVKPRS